LSSVFFEKNEKTFRQNSTKLSDNLGFQSAGDNCQNILKIPTIQKKQKSRRGGHVRRVRKKMGKYV